MRFRVFVILIVFNAYSFSLLTPWCLIHKMWNFFVILKYILNNELSEDKNVKSFNENMCTNFISTQRRRFYITLFMFSSDKSPRMCKNMPHTDKHSNYKNKICMILAWQFGTFDWNLAISSITSCACVRSIHFTTKDRNRSFVGLGSEIAKWQILFIIDWSISDLLDSGFGRLVCKTVWDHSQSLKKKLASRFWASV